VIYDEIIGSEAMKERRRTTSIEFLKERIP